MVQGDQALPDDPGGADPDRFRLPFAADDRAPSAARRAFGAWLDDHGAATAFRDDVLLVVSELVTNSVMHAATTGRIDAELGPTTLRIEVHDDSPTMPALRDADPTTPGGYGLRIVGNLATDWGWVPAEQGRHGKVVWTEHALPVD